MQSLSEVHAFAQLDLHTPPQQRGVVAEPLQSESLVQAFGHEVAWRQSEVWRRAGSRPPALEQHTSPPAVLQSVFDEQAFGQLLAAVQIGVE